MNVLEAIDPLFPVGNAAGHCKSVAEVARLAKSSAQFIVVGSITKEDRAGNPGNTWFPPLNSLGLPNPGLRKIEAVGPEMVSIAHDAGKLIIVSGAGFNLEEYVTLAEATESIGFDGVENNLGCPNIVLGAKRKPIISYEPMLAHRIVMAVCERVKKIHPGFFVSAKLSPYSNPLEIINLADLFSSSPLDAVVTMNAFPNALLFNDDGRPQIQTPDKTGWSGLSGPCIKAIALGQVNQWRTALDEAGASGIQVWGVGGVENGRDVADMQNAGATMVEVGNAYFTRGAKVFGEIAMEFIK